ncbi:hypothetical protein KEM55_001281, partial [Ascosphaera atra]
PDRLTTMSDKMNVDIHTEEQRRIALGQSRLALASAEARDVLRHLPTNELEYWRQQYEAARDEDALVALNRTVIDSYVNVDTDTGQPPRQDGVPAPGLRRRVNRERQTTPQDGNAEPSAGHQPNAAAVEQLSQLVAALQTEMIQLRANSAAQGRPPGDLSQVVRIECAAGAGFSVALDAYI